MELSVSLEEKKNFLQWFADCQLLETYEINWFLDQLLESDTLLSRIHFVEKLKDHHKGIWMGKENSHGFSFLFTKGKIKTEDIYTAYHDLQLHPEEPLFMQLEFQESIHTKLYRTVIEPERKFKQQLQERTDQFLHDLLQKGKRDLLKASIDKALVTGNITDFKNYAQQLNELSEV